MKQMVMMILLAVLTLPFGSMARAAEVYNVDATHSHIGFTVKHMAVSSVRGEFKEYTAVLQVDEDEIAHSTLVITIDAASIDTDDEGRDKHLRSAEFFEVETYPEIVFRSKKIEKADDGRYRATGDLTIKQTTKEIVVDLEINGPIKDPWGNYRVGAEGRLIIDRQDFGVNFSKVMDNGGLLVADDVSIEFSLEAARKPE